MWYQLILNRDLLEREKSGGGWGTLGLGIITFSSFDRYYVLMKVFMRGYQDHSGGLCRGYMLDNWGILCRGYLQDNWGGWCREYLQDNWKGLWRGYLQDNWGLCRDRVNQPCQYKTHNKIKAERKKNAY